MTQRAGADGFHRYFLRGQNLYIPCDTEERPPANGSPGFFDD